VLGLNDGSVVGLERYAVTDGEYLEVFAGFVMVCGVRVLAVSGYFRIDGVVRVG
jgi:hypothetical protein